LIKCKPDGLKIAAFKLKIIEIFQCKVNSNSKPLFIQPNQIIYTGQKTNKKIVQKNTNQLHQYSRQSIHVKPPQNLNHFKLRKLPFYDNIEEIIKLTPQIAQMTNVH
jgi:hypothetical protein